MILAHYFLDRYHRDPLMSTLLWLAYALIRIYDNTVPVGNIIYIRFLLEKTLSFIAELSIRHMYTLCSQHEHMDLNVS